MERRKALLALRCRTVGVVEMAAGMSDRLLQQNDVFRKEIAALKATISKQDLQLKQVN